MSDFEKNWMKIFLKYGLNEHPATKMIYEGYSNFYAGARKLSQNSEFIFDITNVFDNSVGVYTDGVHCDYQGNELISKAIINNLIEAGELT